MQSQTVTDLARGIGRVVHAKTYARIVVGKRTLAYANPRREAVQLDFARSGPRWCPGAASKAYHDQGRPRAPARQRQERGLRTSPAGARREAEGEQE